MSAPSHSNVRSASTLFLLAGITILSGCHHEPKVAYRTPPPPAPRRAPEPSLAPTLPADIPGELAQAPPGFFDDTTTAPTFTETGIASWYGPYGNRRAADGSAYDGMGMTAAHKTLPLGSTIRVTNLVTGQQILVRVTDRGPFAPGRVIDLSINAAKAVGLYRMGIAKVRLEAFRHPNVDPAGKWCVQTGAFKTEADALDLKAALMQRYTGARVAEFAGATGFWVRIDPSQRAKSQADEIADWIGQPDPQALPYIVRLD
jgi:rare lipoprotein A